MFSEIDNENSLCKTVNNFNCDECSIFDESLKQEMESRSVPF